MPVRVITPPASEPVAVADVKTFARIDDTLDAASNAASDALLSSLIVSAREEAEQITRRSLLLQTLELTLGRFPRWGRGVELPRPPFVSITSVTYFDAAGSSVVMDAAGYSLLDASESIPASIYPVGGGFWPDTCRRPDAVRIRYSAGWPSSSAVPENIKTWIKYRTATMYANREGVVVGNVSVAEIPGRFLDGLLDRWRITEVA